MKYLIHVDNCDEINIISGNCKQLELLYSFISKYLVNFSQYFLRPYLKVNEMQWYSDNMGIKVELDQLELSEFRIIYQLVSGINARIQEVRKLDLNPQLLFFLIIY